MHTGLILLQEECASLARRLQDTFALRECARILDRTPVHPSVIEFAASTLVANLAYRVAQVDGTHALSDS